MIGQTTSEPRHDILEDCAVVIRPLPPEPEPPPAYDPLQARVVAGTIAEEVPPPPAPPVIPPPPAPNGVNLQNYYWRPEEGWLRREARVRPVPNPYRGRWYVNRVADGAVAGTRVRGPYLVINMGPETDWVTALPSGSLFGAVLVSGSLYDATPQPVTELLVSEALRDDITRARSGGNPHFDIVANDSVAVFPSGSSPALSPRAVVGCTIPKLRVDVTPILGTWYGETPHLRQAGIWELRWLYHSPYTFHMPDLRSQVAWVLTPDAETPLGEWELGTFAYNNPDTPGESDYRAYRKLIRDIATENAQPMESGFAPDAEALTVVPERLKQFLTDTNEILSRMTSDRNVIRYMHGKALSPIYGVEFARTDGTTEKPPVPKVSGGGGAGWFNPINGTFSSLPSPTTRTN